VKRSKSLGDAAPGRPGATSGYTSDVLLARAETWASKHGYPKISHATFIELRRDRILPEPTRMGRGNRGGRGPSWRWSALAYLRLLRVVRLRGKGIARRRDQRIHLFLGGSDIDTGLIRSDLRDLYVRSARKIVREYGVEYASRDDRMPSKVAAEAHMILDPGLFEGFLKAEGSNVPPEFAIALREVVASPAMRRMVDSLLKQSVLPDDDAGLPGLRHDLAQLPIAVGLAADLDESARNMAGLLADPEIGNAIVESLDRLSDQDLVVLRDYVLAWPDLLAGMKAVMAALPSDPHAVAIVATSRLLSVLGAGLSRKNPAMLLGFFVARAAVVQTFMNSARISVQMRPGAVLRELARRGAVDRQPTPDEMEEILAAAGVVPEHWHYWLDPAR